MEDNRIGENITIKTACDEHGSDLESFCRTHDVAICKTCLTSYHENCSDFIIPLEEAATNAKTSTALDGVSASIDGALEKLQRVIEDCGMVSTNIEEQEKSVKKSVQNIRFTVNKRMDELEEKLLTKLSETCKNYKTKNVEFITKLSRTNDEIKRLKKQTVQLKRFDSDSQVFLGTRQIDKKVHEEIESVKMSLSSVRKYKVEIEVNQELTSLLENINSFGQIKVQENAVSTPFVFKNIDQAQTQLYKPVRSVHNTTFNFRSKFSLKEQIKNLEITGATTLPNGHVLIANYTSDKVLIECNDIGQHIRNIPVSGMAYDVTVIDGESIAVSHGESKRMDILNIENGTVIKTTDIKGSCWGLSCHDNRIYVLVESEGIVVMDTSGKMLNTIKCNVSCFDIAAVKDRIYYTDYVENTVHCCSMTGDEIWVFSDKYLVCPRGISVDNIHNVFVAGLVSNNLFIIQNDGKVSKMLLTESDGLNHPIPVCYNKNK
ncbi:uncharacterized protein LOC127737295 [Mytilus californianus]|uniref:uncharacterized protein LOC127737295 n=1 Tax=Mytilus californianus TaxID=6549 RepID=UPI0022474AF6|nr:uncharacterized protein LOC127737295 [Mytilus californianus]XP_052103844.1 uncharacterized protein LOC127737295 [Mytilus californianus]XP_052103845.1 uncharacterized protein LOC127737295 [Mytilus californianus]